MRKIILNIMVKEMIDLEIEHKNYEKCALQASGGWASFKKYSNGHYHSDKVNFGFDMWLKRAEQGNTEIEALKAKLEQSEKVWISVDFMLPNEGEKVLIMIGDEQTVAEKCSVFGFIDVIDREALRTDLITYWMPLPKPPVKEVEGD